MDPENGFRLETTQTLLEHRIRVYKFKESDFRIIFVNAKGPLCSLSIVVPTIPENDAGLPHTLEHLVFCGSVSHKRGFLDTMATRALSNGTNAYTCQDHTCYEITTAGWDGMKDIFPVFLEHILRPTLTESQFLTEVYHLDGEAKQQGVVYCEMAARQNTEADLLDINLRRLLYDCPIYSKECGGLTEEIAKLKNKDIIRYHQKYYNLNHITAIISGSVYPQELFEELAKHDWLLDLKEPQISFPTNSVHPEPLKDLFISKVIHFPSSDEDVGSIGYGWLGPPGEDIRTQVALDVLFRFLQETPASLLNQHFVELKSPISRYI